MRRPPGLAASVGTDTAENKMRLRRNRMMQVVGFLRNPL
jgi:hypothetical protein